MKRRKRASLVMLMQFVKNSLTILTSEKLQVTNLSARKKTYITEEIVETHRLNAKCGNYAEVGRQMGRSGSTVAKYIKMKGTPDIVKHTFKEFVRG